MEPVAVYVHTPFCPSKCGYCDFNSYAIQGEIVERTVTAMVREIESSPWRGRPAKTIFFGGGTPTYLSETQLLSVLEAVFKAHPPVDGAEITSEANPGTADADKFSAMRRAGFNRISLGAQSFQSEDLIRMGRVHGAIDVGIAVDMARKAGFENLNLDLMFGLPGQSLSDWKRNLDLAMMLHPDHLSLYCLTIEPNTRFNRLHKRGMLNLPDEEHQVGMYEMAMEATAEMGLRQYEISNFAKPGRECRHNLCYWHGEEYLGYGPGAVGCFESKEHKTRYTNMKHPERYSDAVESGSNLWCESEVLDADTIRSERVMLGIRLNEGISSSDVDPTGVSALVAKGWVDQMGDRLRLTSEGKHFCSQVAATLM